MKFLLYLGLAMSSAAASAQEVLLATDAVSGTKVYANVTSTRLILRTVGPRPVSVSYAFDVNLNRAIDPRVDREYGFTSSLDYCPAFKLSKTASTQCGGAPSGGSGVVTITDKSRSSRIDLPIAEVTTNRDRFRFELAFWNDEVKSSAVKLVDFRPSGAARAQVGSPSSGKSSNPCPSTMADLARYLGGFRETSNKAEVSGVTTAQITLFGSVGEKTYDTSRMNVLGARPSYMEVGISGGKPIDLEWHLPGADATRYAAAFRGAIAGEVRCDKYGCTWATKTDFWKDRIGSLTGIRLGTSVLNPGVSTLRCAYKSY